MEGKRTIVLCGFMGCGKSTVGPIVARLSGRRFLDMDAFIEQRAGKSISEIFASEGEARFRELEREAAAEFARERDLVVAAGGGALVQTAVAETLRAACAVVLLDAPLDEIRERLRGDTTRPLLQRPDRDEAMSALYAARLPVYRQAAHVAVHAAGTPEETAVAVLRRGETPARRPARRPNGPRTKFAIDKRQKESYDIFCWNIQAGLRAARKRRSIHGRSVQCTI